MIITLVINKETKLCKIWRVNIDPAIKMRKFQKKEHQKICSSSLTCAAEKWLFEFSHSFQVNSELPKERAAAEIEHER